MRRKSYSLQFFTIFILLLGALSVLGYQWYRQTQENKYFAEIEEVQAKTNKKIARLNEDLELFQTEPQVAKKILPKFKEAEKALREVFRDLKRVKPLPKFKKLHQSLLKLYLKSANLSSDLSYIAGYIKEREKLLKNLSEDSKAFDKKIKKATRDEQLIEAAKLLRKSADGTLNKLQNLEVPLKIYSSNQLEKYLTELSQSLALLQQAIEKKDVKEVEAAVSRLNQVFSKDWSKALLELDSSSLKIYQKQVFEINRLQNQITQEVSKLETE